MSHPVSKTLSSLCSVISEDPRLAALVMGERALGSVAVVVVSAACASALARVLKQQLQGWQLGVFYGKHVRIGFQ